MGFVDYGNDENNGKEALGIYLLCITLNEYKATINDARFFHVLVFTMKIMMAPMEVMLRMKCPMAQQQKSNQW